MKNTLKIGLLFGLSLVIFTACGKPSATNHELGTTNLVHNGDFEQGTSSPDGWHTKNQFLNDVTGWATDESHSGKHSLKIENIGGSDACWEGAPIIFKEAANAFDVSVWTKTKSIKNIKGSFCLSFDVFYKNGEGKELYQAAYLDISEFKDEWKQTKGRLTFLGNISRIIPKVHFSQTAGTVYVDDINLSPISMDFNKGKILFDSNKGEGCTGTYTKVQDNLFKCKGPSGSFVTDYIPVIPGKTYKLSGEFKSLGKNESTLCFGLEPYTKNKSAISRASIYYSKGSETELVRACKATDKVLYVKNAENWTPYLYSCAAFDVDDSGNLKDLPNFNLSSFGVEKIEQVGENWGIYFSKEIGKNYAKGTKIREHTSGGGLFSAAVSQAVPDNWTKYEGITANSRSIISNSDMYPGAKYVKILIITSGTNKSSSVLFKDIKLTEL